MASITQAQLRNRALETMEDDLRIPNKNAMDFIESLKAVIQEELAEGNVIPLFGIVRITPAGVPAKPRRKGTDRETGEEKWLDPAPAKIRVRAGVAKAFKDVLPDPTDKAGKRLISETKARQAKAAERAAARAAEEEKEAKKAARKKPVAKKKGKGKK